MAYTLPSDKQVDLQVAYVDANNNPAQVDGEPTWESSDEEIARVEPSSGKQVTLIPGTKVGNCQISAKADADVGQGVEELVTLLDVTTVAGKAVAGTITPTGEPVPKP